MSAATLILALPQEAKATGFDHAMLDWNPMGHEPDMVYTLPHFDFHFYTVTEAAQMAIMPTDPQYEAKLEKMPAEAFRPVGNIKLPSGVPMMGAHWVDPTSPELQPPPNNKTFTRTFLYGSYDGHFIFYEPMITKVHIESVKSVAGGHHHDADQARDELREAGLLSDAVHHSVGRRGQGISHCAGQPRPAQPITTSTVEKERCARVRSFDGVSAFSRAPSPWS